MHIESRFARRIALAASVVVAAALVAGFPTGAQAGTATVTPSTITTTAGAVGAGQPVSNLAVRDLSGSTDDWNRYVEFSGAYYGYLTYGLPAWVLPSSVIGVSVQLNYRGPSAATQTWTFSLFDWRANAWVPVGNNASAPEWGAWKLLTFNPGGTASNYVSATRTMRLRLQANNAQDAADVDYAGIGLTTSGGSDPTAPTAPGNLAVTGKTSSSVSLSWLASTDNVGVTGYEVYVGSGTVPALTVTGTSATVSGLTPATSYAFAVRALDAAGNRSAPSNRLSLSTAPAGSGLPAPVACPGCWHPALRSSWNWVISKVPTAPYRPVAVYDIDGFEATAADVQALHNAGKKVICYLSVGSAENWRPDAAQFPAGIVGQALDGWPGERWLDIRDVQRAGSALARIMNARLDMCDSKGFDAVEFDSMDGYTNVTGFPLTARDQAIYNVFLANGARSRGMSAVMKNDIDQIPELLPYFDLAINESCAVYSECGAYAQFVRVGKAVLHAEYGSSTSFCAADNAANLNGVRFARNLDDSVFQPCR